AALKAASGYVARSMELAYAAPPAFGGRATYHFHCQPTLVRGSKKAQQGLALPNRCWCENSLRRSIKMTFMALFWTMRRLLSPESISPLNEMNLAQRFQQPFDGVPSCRHLAQRAWT